MRDPDEIKGLLGPMASKLGMESPIQTAKVFAGWEEIVGTEISSRCHPTSIKSGILRLSTLSPAWASELRYLEREIVGRVNSWVGQSLIVKVELWVASSGDAASKGGFTTRKDKPARVESEAQTNDRLGRPTEASEKDALEAERLTESIPDSKLAEATKRALLAGKMRKRRR
jgi:hypothetical protein